MSLCPQKGISGRKKDRILLVSVLGGVEVR